MEKKNWSFLRADFSVCAIHACLAIQVIVKQQGVLDHTLELVQAIAQVREMLD